MNISAQKLELIQMQTRNRFPRVSNTILVLLCTILASHYNHSYQCSNYPNHIRVAISDERYHKSIEHILKQSLLCKNYEIYISCCSNDNPCKMEPLLN